MYVSNNNMKVITPSIFILTIFLFSCNPPERNQHPTEQSFSQLNDTLHIIKEFSGLLSYGKNEKTFISCADPGMIHLVKNNDQIDTIFKSLLPNAYDGESIFLKIMAKIEPASEKKYADQLEIKKIITAEQKNHKNTCIPYDFWCKGNEPFWQLQISEKENLIDFYDPMQQHTTHFLYNKPDTKNNVIIYSSKDENSKNEIFVRIRKEKCSDGMSEIEYKYSAEISLNGDKFKGCAVKNGEQ